MSRLSWGLVGERHYETGIDRGVLYVDDTPGVPWNGLISIDESPSGGDPKPYYQDGIKYDNRAAAEEFEATLTAFSSPVEFDAVDGSTHAFPGLIVTAQRRKPFGLTYRTKVGNDVDNEDFGYKIHLVYNALAAPSENNRETMNDSVNPIEFSWSITTTPESAVGYKPTAHFIIDSRTTDPDLLATIEDILYGTDTTDPRLPTPAELMDLYYTAAHPPIVYSTILRLARASLETVIKGVSGANVAQSSIQTVIKGASKARLTRHSVEVVIRNVATLVKLSRSSLETVIKGTSSARLSRQSVQTVIKGTSNARTSRQSVEVVITN